MPNETHIALISDFPIAEIVSAPGHRTLRNPGAIVAMANAMAAGAFAGVTDEFILLGIFTHGGGGAAAGGFRAVECLDGHHRLLAALKSGLWKTVRDIPAGVVDTRLDGVRAGSAQCEARWIPKAAADASDIPASERSPVPAEWGAKGETVMISGAISSVDEIFHPQVRGAPLSKLLEELRGSAR